MIGGEIVMTILLLILDYFKEKLMAAYFIKPKKNSISGLFWALFPKIWTNELSWKKGLCQFLDIPIIYHRAKNQ